MANSTTTTIATRAALDISLMDTFKAFFDYMTVTLCGIPSVTLKGTVQDWVQLKEFAKYIGGKFDFDWYTNKIVWILDEIINTCQGNGNVEFWKKMVKSEGESGGPYYMGWIKYLFPYLSGYSGKVQRSSNYLDDNYNITSSVVPSGMTNLPFLWDYLGTIFPMRFSAGFVGTVVTAEGRVTPGVSWAIAAIEDTVNPLFLTIYHAKNYRVTDKYECYKRCEKCKRNYMQGCFEHDGKYLCLKCAAEIDELLNKRHY